MHYLRPFCVVLSLSPLVASYSFVFTTPPQQCGQVTLELDTSDGKPGTPPYRALIVPAGPAPGGVEIRHILDEPFPNGANSVTFQLPYPASSHLVAMISDSKGVGTGGTSNQVNVTDSPSGDSSCLPSTSSNPSTPDFFIYLTPPGLLTQCVSTHISWDASAQSPVTLYGVIPGGTSFEISTNGAATGSDGKPGIDWLVNVIAGTSMMIVGGDKRGGGAGGSIAVTVNEGDNSCINSSSPSLTPGPPAGGTYATLSVGPGVATPTLTPGSTTPSGGSGGSGSSNSHHSNTGAIVGAVIGALLLLAFLGLGLLLFRRHRRRTRKARGVDLIDGPVLHQTPSRESPGGNNQSRWYEPVPFILPGSRAGTHTSSNQQAYPRSPTSGARYSSDQTHTPSDAAFGFGRSSHAPPSSALLFGAGASTPEDSESPRRQTPSRRPAAPGSGSPALSREGSVSASSSTSHGLHRPRDSDPAALALGRDAHSSQVSLSSSRRKSTPGPSGALRAVNVFQHEDAGEIMQTAPPTTGGEPPEVVELPPSYASVSNLRGSQGTQA